MKWIFKLFGFWLLVLLSHIILYWVVNLVFFSFVYLSFDSQDGFGVLGLASTIMMVDIFGKYVIPKLFSIVTENQIQIAKIISIWVILLLIVYPILLIRQNYSTLWFHNIFFYVISRLFVSGVLIENNISYPKINGMIFNSD